MSGLTVILIALCICEPVLIGSVTVIVMCAREMRRMHRLADCVERLVDEAKDAGDRALDTLRPEDIEKAEAAFSMAEAAASMALAELGE